MPITDCFVVYARVQSLSPAQRHHAKIYATGLVTGCNKTCAGITREVLPTNSKRALNKFLTEYDWDEQQFTHERLDELQKHSETRWSKDGYIILDDMIIKKAEDEVPASATSMITLKAILSGAKTLFMPSTPTTKPPTRSSFASTKSKTRTTKTTTPSTISPARSSLPVQLVVRPRFWLS